MQTYDSESGNGYITVPRDDSIKFEKFPALKLVQSFVQQSIKELETYSKDLPYNEETELWLNRLVEFDEFVTRVRS